MLRIIALLAGTLDQGADVRCKTIDNVRDEGRLGLRCVAATAVAGVPKLYEARWGGGCLLAARVSLELVASENSSTCSDSGRLVLARRLRIFSSTTAASSTSGCQATDTNVW
jgi:hypothetical protein